MVFDWGVYRIKKQKKKKKSIQYTKVKTNNRNMKDATRDRKTREKTEMKMDDN